MNSKIIALFAAAALFTTDALAEPSANMLVIDPGALLNGVVALQYERALNTLLGLELGVSVLGFRGVFAPADQNGLVAFGPEVGIRFHLIGDAPGGLWLGPTLNGFYVSSGTGGAVRPFGYGLGAAVGYNLIIARHFVLELGAGGGFNDYGSGPVWQPRLILGIGGAF